MKIISSGCMWQGKPHMAECEYYKKTSTRASSRNLYFDSELGYRQAIVKKPFDYWFLRQIFPFSKFLFNAIMISFIILMYGLHKRWSHTISLITNIGTCRNSASTTTCVYFLICCKSLYSFWNEKIQADINNRPNERKYPFTLVEHICWSASCT